MKSIELHYIYKVVCKRFRHSKKTECLATFCMNYYTVMKSIVGHYVFKRYWSEVYRSTLWTNLKLRKKLKLLFHINYCTAIKSTVDYVKFLITMTLARLRCIFKCGYFLQYCLNGKCVAEHENIIPDYSQNTPSYIRGSGNVQGRPL